MFFQAAGERAEEARDAEAAAKAAEMEETTATSEAKAAASAASAAQQRVDDLLRQLEEAEMKRARMADEVRRHTPPFLQNGD